MDTRTVETILAEWRECERALETADEVDREGLEARCAALAIEHREALARRKAKAKDLAHLA